MTVDLNIVINTIDIYVTMSKSGIMRWNRFRNFEATYLANPGS